MSSSPFLSTGTRSSASSSRRIFEASDSDKPDWSHRDLEQIESLLEAHGYSRAATTYVNTIYVHRTRR